MADYTTIDPNSLLPGKPWTSALAQAAYENPEAMREGATGAPVEVTGWHGHNQTVIGTGSALIWDHAATGNVASIETPVLQAGFEYRLSIDGLVSDGTTGSETTLDFRRQSSGAYVLGIALWADNKITVGKVEFEQLTQSTNGKLALVNLGFGATTTWQDATLTTHISTAFGVSRSSAWVCDRLRLRAGGAANYTGGRVMLYRRRLMGAP